MILGEEGTKPLAVYRSKRKATPMERIMTGFWLLGAGFYAVLFWVSLKELQLSALVAPIAFLALFLRGIAGWSRKTNLEIHESWIVCEPLPGKIKIVWFATMVELAESDFDLRIAHLTNDGHAAFSLWKSNFEPDEWPEIVATITSAASRQSPRLQMHVSKSG